MTVVRIVFLTAIVASTITTSTTSTVKDSAQLSSASSLTNISGELTTATATTKWIYLVSVKPSISCIISTTAARPKSFVPFINISISLLFFSKHVAADDADGFFSCSELVIFFLRRDISL